MTNIRNICFIAIVAVALITPAMSWHLETEAPKSYLEGRARPKVTALMWKAVAQGKWQSAFDAALAFSVPNRDEALLADARWQRKMIGVAAWLFRFDAYPTFYGSNICRVGTLDALVEIPKKISVRKKEQLKNVAEIFNTIINAYPKQRWYFALTDNKARSLASPIHNLVSNPADSIFYRANFLEYLTKICTIIDLILKE